MRDGFNPLLLRESDDANNYNANEDYSGAIKRFLLTPASTDIYIVKRLIVTVSDSDTNYNLFGALSALANGVRIVLETTAGTELVDLLAGTSIKTLGDFLTAGFEVLPINNSADGTTKIVQFAKTFEDLVIRGSASERLAALYHDNLVGLDGNSILAEVEKQTA